jgi:hypothetical protein
MNAPTKFSGKDLFSWNNEGQSRAFRYGSVVSLSDNGGQPFQISDHLVA